MTSVTDEQRLVAGLTGFVANWRAATSDNNMEHRLARFFSDARPLLRAGRQPHVERRELPPEQLAECFRLLAPALAEVRSAGLIMNPWTVAGLKRAEVRNAAVLASLWSPLQGGALAIAFLDAFLRRIETPDHPLPATARLAKGYAVRTEHCPIGEASERVDLTIEGEDFLIGIEVKIDAGEGEKQLERYVSSIEHWGDMRRKPAHVVFLAPFSSRTPGVLSASWSDVIAAARAVLPRQQPDFGFNHHLVDSFARHAAQFRRKHH
jgi:hypothetical protein